MSQAGPEFPSGKSCFYSLLIQEYDFHQVNPVPHSFSSQEQNFKNVTSKNWIAINEFE